MLQTTNYKLQATNYELQTTNYKLQTTNYKLLTTNFNLLELLIEQGQFELCETMVNGRTVIAIRPKAIIWAMITALIFNQISDLKL